MVWKRKNEEGKIEVVSNFENHIDRMVREARDAGHFNNLAGHGKPLNLEDNPFAGEWGAAYRMVANSGATLPWIDLNNDILQLDEQRRQLLQKAAQYAKKMQEAVFLRPEQVPWYKRERERQRKQFQQHVERYNAEIYRFNIMCPVHALAKATLPVKAELQLFDRTWAPSSKYE